MRKIVMVHSNLSFKIGCVFYYFIDIESSITAQQKEDKDKLH